MARITSEDCLEHVDNIFDLVLIGSRRARLLMSGAEQPYLTSNDKNTVLALREISLGKVDSSILDSDDLSPLFASGSRFAREDQQQEPESPEQTEELRQIEDALLSSEDTDTASADTDESAKAEANAPEADTAEANTADTTAEDSEAK